LLKQVATLEAQINPEPLLNGLRVPIYTESIYDFTQAGRPFALPRSLWALETLEAAIGADAEHCLLLPSGSGNQASEEEA
jgi:hypothetical protein